jgi:malate dehydrogenase
MDISIVGAGGTIGRAIAVGIVQNRVLPATARLQLVERPDPGCEWHLRGFAADLSDAFAERLPELDLAFSPRDVLGDIVIMAGGATLPQDLEHLPDRGDLARVNLPVFEEYARNLEEHGHGEELILVVSNPVELGVKVFCRHLARERVIGMGAYLDTLRFRHEIAGELGVRRQAVEGLVLGEHGFGIVPCWSTVSAWGFDSPEGKRRIESLRRPAPDRKEVLADLLRLMREQPPGAAYARLERLPADLRAILRPLVTHMSGARTPLGAAEMIIRLIQALVNGNQALAAAQVGVEGEFLGIRGVTGVPVVLSIRGVERFEPIQLWAEEALAVKAAAERSGEMFRSLGLKG